MASVFKLGREKGKRNAYWYFEYQDHQGKKRMKKGFTDKALTRQLAAKLENDSRQRKLGLIDIELEEQAHKRNSAVSKQLQDYERSLRAKENSEKHVKLTISRVQRIVDGCEFESLRDLNADDVETFLSELRVEDNIGHRTYNHYLQAIDAWCNWMVGRNRLEQNPVAGISRLNTEVDVRHPRRALTPIEFSKLLSAANRSDRSIQCYDGEMRARIYTLSYMTGLRKNELASLTAKSFKLDKDPPTVTIEARSSKHREKDILPLHPDLVGQVHEWINGKPRDEPLFPKLAKRKTWLMVKKDLESVGVPYRTDEGIADFHAAGRHTHITELLRNGATLPEARELARHSDVRMTMRYTHISLEDQAKAIRSLPSPKQTCQDIVRKLDFPACPRESADVCDSPDDEPGPESENPCESRGNGDDCHPVSSVVNENQKWRRRGSNPRPAMLP